MQTIEGSGRTYMELYLKYQDAAMIAPTRKEFDGIYARTERAAESAVSMVVVRRTIYGPAGVGGDV